MSNECEHKCKCDGAYPNQLIRGLLDGCIIFVTILLIIGGNCSC